MTEEQRDVALKYLPIAKRRANQFTDAYNLDIEEIRSVAFEALVSALASGTYDPARGKISTFLYAKITFGLKDWMRENRHRRARRHVRLSSRAPGVRHSPADPASERDREMAEVRDAAEVLLSRAGERERHVLRACYLEGRTHEQVAAAMNMGKTNVARIKEGGLEIIRSSVGMDPP